MRNVLNSPKLRDVVMLAIIAVAVIAMLFSWLAEIICLASGILFLVLLFVFLYLWETADIEYDAKVCAKEMSKMHIDENSGWKELILHGDFKELALKKGPERAAAIYFLIYFGTVAIGFALTYAFYPKKDIAYPIIFLLGFGATGLIRAYAKSKTYRMAIEMLEKGEYDDYREPEPTFPAGGDR